MIMDKNNFLVEAKADIDRFKNWLLQYGNDDEESLTPYLDYFLSVRNNIKSPYNDFYHWIKNSTQKDFLEYIIQLKNDREEKNRVKTAEKEGAELIYSDDTWKVYHITNYEASAKYGKGTKWCITGTDRWNDGNSGKDTFKQYHETNHVEFYFFIKNGTEKYAVALYPDGETTEIFNAEDVSIAYIPDAPHIEDFPDVSIKDDKKLLINAIASNKIPDNIIMNAMIELTSNSDDYSIYVTDNPKVASSVMSEKIPDGYLEYNAVEIGELTPEEYEAITGEEYYEGGWDGDWADIDLGDEYSTKADACDIERFKKHKYWIFFTDFNSWSSGDLYYADDSVGLFNNVSQMLDFKSMYEFIEAIADMILIDVKEGKVSRELLTNLGISNEYIDSLSETYHLTESLESDYESLVKMSIDNMNKFLDEFGFEVELVDYDFKEDALGMFVNSVQDNASVFPIALNKELIINKSDEYEVDLDTAILTTIAHEVGHGLFEYLEDFYDLEDANEEDVVEEFARDYYDNNLSDNTLYRLLLDYQIEDEELNESLLEMRGKGNISNERILKYVEECINDLKKINFGNIDTDCLTYDDIDIEEGDTNHTFGAMFLPLNGVGNFKLVLNKYMFDEPEEAIKNTIYHELCHYITDKLAIDCGAIYTKNGKWYISNHAKEYHGHGKMWKHIADVVGNAVGHDITRTNSFDLHTGVGKHYNDNVKYIVKCKHCGNEFRYTRKSPFIKSIIDGNGHTDWYCNCSDGTKSHDFEIIKGN